MANLKRQYELAIEERFRTNSFPFKFQTTIIPGLAAANASALFKYHCKSLAQPASFHDFVEQVAYDGMNDEWDKLQGTETGSAHASSSHHNPHPSMEHAAPSHAHTAVPIKNVTGWLGGRRQKCGHCGDACTTCCALCSDANSIVVVCKSEVCYQGKTKRCPCLTEHRRRPAASKRTTASPARSRAAKQRNKARAQRK